MLSQLAALFLEFRLFLFWVKKKISLKFHVHHSEIWNFRIFNLKIENFSISAFFSKNILAYLKTIPKYRSANYWCLGVERGHICKSSDFLILKNHPKKQGFQRQSSLLSPRTLFHKGSFWTSITISSPKKNNLACAGGRGTTVGTHTAPPWLSL